jgi:colanic acid/amylovoran biosynthesis glycosyltransferase
MRVYLFIEHYPNPYKPWIDTQLVQLIRAGHEVRIFAEASFTSTIHDEVRAYDLHAKTSYYPATLRALQRDALPAVKRGVADPIRQFRRAQAAAGHGSSPKRQLLDATRALLLPIEAPDLCYVHNLVTASRLTFLKRLYPQTRICMYFHGGEVGGQPTVHGESDIFAGVDAVITSTRFAAAQAVERGCAADKIAIVPLGFPLGGYAMSPQRSYRPDGKVRFVSVGRMSPEKGVLVALKAVKGLVESDAPPFVYKLVGSGIQLAELRQFVADEHLDGVVRFLGEKTRQQVAEELERSDVFVLPSIVTDVWAETQATVVQEALLMGCLTITTLAGGVPESNAEAMQQFAVPPSDVNSLQAVMRRVAGLDSAAMASLGRAGRQFAVERYDIVPLMERILVHALDKLPRNHPSRFVSSASVGNGAG